MVRTEFGRIITKDIEDMTIAEYMEYEAEIKRNPWSYVKSYTRNSGTINLGEKKDHNDCQLSTPNSHNETKEVTSDEDVDEWLNAEMGKHIGHDKDDKEDALIDILKTVVEECKLIYKKAQIPSSKTSKIQGVSFVAEEEEGEVQKPYHTSNRARINMIPKSLFEHLKLTNLKKTSMVVEIADMTKRPIAIVENIPVKIDKFLFCSNFIVTDTLEGPNETMLLDHERQSVKGNGMKFADFLKCMRTRNSYFPNNSSVTIPRRQNKRCTLNVVVSELRTIVEVEPMVDNRTMEELLQAPTEGYGKAIIILEINADHFEIKTNLLQLVQANPYHGFERENPHTHINNFKMITSTLKFRDVPNDVIKLMMFPYSLEGSVRVWYDKEPPNSILTWEDLVKNFMNQFFPPSKTTHLKNEISRFIQRFEETLGEAWERFKEMLMLEIRK
nr:reverse transcriptase domain-containing protein [Tanacetum cinerariifolium]